MLRHGGVLVIAAHAPRSIGSQTQQPIADRSPTPPDGVSLPLTVHDRRELHDPRVGRLGDRGKIGVGRG